MLWLYRVGPQPGELPGLSERVPAEEGSPYTVAGCMGLNTQRSEKQPYAASFVVQPRRESASHGRVQLQSSTWYAAENSCSTVRTCQSDCSTAVSGTRGPAAPGREAHLTFSQLGRAGGWGGGRTHLLLALVI